MGAERPAALSPLRVLSQLAHASRRAFLNLYHADSLLKTQYTHAAPYTFKCCTQVGLARTHAGGW